MATVDPKDPTSQEDIHYEKYDFPVVEYSRGESLTDTIIYIDWNSYGEKSSLISKLDDEICLPEATINDFIEELESLKAKYHMSMVKPSFIKRDDGTLALSTICDYGSNGLWMHIYSGEKDHEGTTLHNYLQKEHKIDTHNLDFPYQALFFTECLAKYFKHLGIEFPYIQTKKTGEEEKELFNGHKKTINILSFSFSIPYEEKNYTTIKNILQRHSSNLNVNSEDISISEEYLFIKDKSYGMFVTNKKGERIFQSEELESANDAIQIFSAFSSPLKIKLFDELE